jgi:hypothetical protein
MKKIIVLFVLCLKMISLTGCKNDITDPPPVEVEPGRRDYVWDTYYLEPPPSEVTLICQMWGSNLKDIWATGSASLSLYGIWHFNGSKGDY